MKKPDPKPLVIVSVDDIYLYGKQIGKKVTMKQAIEIFENIDSSDWDMEFTTFWSFIENEIDNYKENMKNG